MTDKVQATCLSLYPRRRQPTLTAPKNHKKEVRSDGEEGLVRLKDAHTKDVHTVRSTVPLVSVLHS